MKTATLAIGLALSASACGLLAQQQSMPDMPGMNMPSAQQSQPAQHAKPEKPKGSEQQQSMPDMPGMNMSPPQTPQPNAPAKPGMPNHNQKPSEAMPKDMQGMDQDSGNAKAQRNAASIQNSVQQQAGQANKMPGADSDQKSLHVPIQELQEPEATDFRTGGDMPAPELLGPVVQRDPMTLEQFLALADKTNPTLAQAQQNVDRSNQQARQISLPPNPIVGYSGDHIRGGEYRGGEQGVSFTQEFVLGHKLALRRDIYRAEGRSNRYALEVQRARVHNDVARAFFDTLAAQQSVIIHDRLLKVALDADTNAHELSRIGQVDAAAILTAEIAAEHARVEFVNAQRTFLAHFARLATASGQHALETHPLKGALVDPPALDPEEYVHRDSEESPLVKRAQAEEALGEARLKDARRERVPNLNVTAGEWYGGEPVRSGKRVGWESFLQAGVNVPLWNHNQGNIKAATILLDRAHKDVDRTKLWTESRTEPLAQDYQTARFTADRYRTEMLPRARRAYELQVTKYQQMSLEYPPVLAAQEMFFTLQLGYTEALDQEWQAAIALQNYSLMDGLDDPINTGSDSTTINLPTAPGGKE
ncbi:MAG: TolC family protein [Acidobacteriaceae bacterium]